MVFITGGSYSSVFVFDLRKTYTPHVN